MYLIIIFVILAVIFLNAVIFDSYWDFEIILMHIFMTFVGTLIGLLIGMLSMKTLAEFYPSTYDKVVVHELVSLDDGSSNEGRFVFGSGTIEDNLVYTYYRKSKDGGVVRRSISANLATIYESDTVTVPRLHVHIVSDDDETYKWTAGTRHHNWQLYKLYVPTGTVIKELNLDNR